MCLHGAGRDSLAFTYYLTVMKSSLYYKHLIVMPIRFEKTDYFVFLKRGSPHRTEAVLFRSYYTARARAHTHTHTHTLGRIPLDE